MARAAARPRPRRRLAASALLCALPLAACGASGPAAPQASPGRSPARTPAAPSSDGSPGPSSGPSSSAERPAVLAFAGDVHFEGVAAAAPGTDLGSAFGVLADADAAVVNLETAVTTGGEAAPKQYVFRAPPEDLRALKDAGVDAVSLANNHGMDYGRTGLDDTLAAAQEAELPVLGAGRDRAQAFAPWRTTVRGVHVAVLAATDVLDTFATDTWPAGPQTAGLASAKDPGRLLAAVREEAADADVVVVFLHWGVERQVCPTARQQHLAAELARAGADVVVGSHAHVLQPLATAGEALVAYGLGNFHFYARGGAGARTGVLSVSVDRSGVLGSAWTPATITAGRPQVDTGADAERRAGELPALCPGAS